MDENTDPYHLVFFRNGAEEYIFYLEEMASIVLATDLLSPEERNNLKRSLDQLRSSFDQIKRLKNSHAFSKLKSLGKAFLIKVQKDVY